MKRRLHHASYLHLPNHKQEEQEGHLMDNIRDHQGLEPQGKQGSLLKDHQEAEATEQAMEDLEDLRKGLQDFQEADQEDTPLLDPEDLVDKGQEHRHLHLPQEEWTSPCGLDTLTEAHGMHSGGTSTQKSAKT